MLYFYASQEGKMQSEGDVVKDGAGQGDNIPSGLLAPRDDTTITSHSAEDFMSCKI